MTLVSMASIWIVRWTLAGGLAAAATPATPAQKLKQLYVEGMASYQKQEWAKATNALQQLLPLFRQVQATRKANSQAYHLMTIGRADVLYYLAGATWKQKQRLASCRHHQAIAEAIGSLPPGWRSWSVRPELPNHFQASALFLQGPCRKVPSLVVLDIVPKQLKDLQVFVQTPSGQWQPRPSPVLQVLTVALSLQVKAPGYITHTIEQRFVPRWHTTRLRIQLQPKPKARVAVIKRVIVPLRRTPQRLPPPDIALPFYKTWWFWTVTGVVVAGGATGVILYYTLPRRYALQTAEGGGFRISK